jgi:hypothetical protein
MKLGKDDTTKYASRARGKKTKELAQGKWGSWNRLRISERHERNLRRAKLGGSERT